MRFNLMVYFLKQPIQNSEKLINERTS